MAQEQATAFAKTLPASRKDSLTVIAYDLTLLKHSGYLVPPIKKVGREFSESPAKCIGIVRLQAWFASK